MGSTVTDSVAGTQSRRAPRRLIGRNRLRTILITTFTSLLMLVFLWPFLCILAWSFNRLDAYMSPLVPIPAEFSTKFYQVMVTDYGFHRFIWNSVIVAIGSTALSVLASALAGFALAKYRFAGRNTVFVVVLGIMLLPHQTMIVSRFMVLEQLGLVNSFWGLILPTIADSARNVFFMRQFMLQVPTEMLEAGRIDGASEFGLFFKIVLPIMRAPVGVVATLALQASWNALLWPQIIISDRAKTLLMPAIAQLQSSSTSDPYTVPVVVAGAITAAVVPLALYSYSQKYFVSAMTGAIKM